LKVLGDAAMIGRLTRDLPAFLRERMTPDRARAIVTRRLETRGERFLRMMERVVYGHPASPYRWLLRTAGCEPGDLRALVAREGVEGALAELAAEGVHLTSDEFKCRRPIVRGSARLVPVEEDFDNPAVLPHFERWTSGSRSRGTTVKMSLSYVAEAAANHALALDAHGLAEADHAVWLTGPFIYLLTFAKLGRPPLAWFHPLRPLPWKAWAVGRYVQGLGRLLSCPLPGPTWIDLQAPERLVTWLAARLAEGHNVCVTTYASSAVRVAVAARERGVSLKGVHFLTLGEPFTEAKQRAVEAAGALGVVRYGFVEITLDACACPDRRSADDQHLFSDGLAVIQAPDPAGVSGLAVGRFRFTTLLANAPKILLNVENGDFGILERRPCHCALGALGLRDHISQVRSHEKLTSEGMTFVATDLARVLEEVLPTRFGGSGADYQVLEEEAGQGLVRLYLLVHPRIEGVDPAAVKRVFLEELARGGHLERYMASMWERAETVEVRRHAPQPTGSGKVLFFHVANRRAHVSGRDGVPVR
jgi:hypothetical protein